MAKAKGKAGLKIVTAEARDVRKRFEELYDKANQRLPSGTAPKTAEAAGDALRALLRDNPEEELWRRIQGSMAVAESHAVENFPGATPGVKETWRPRLIETRRDLAGDNPSQVETLLAHHAALCWLRLSHAELLYTAKLAGSCTYAAGVFYTKLLTAAQRRFTRACETLERVRMMRRRAAQIGAPAEAERRRA